MITQIKRPPRARARKTFAGVIGLGTLTVRRGAFVRKTDKAGEILSDERDDRAQLWLNIGQLLLVTAKSPANDEIGIVEVGSILRSDWDEQRLGVVLRAGLVSAGEVWVMDARAIRPTKTKKRAA